MVSMTSLPWRRRCFIRWFLSGGMYGQLCVGGFVDDIWLIMARRVRLCYHCGFVIELPFVCCQRAFHGPYSALPTTPCPQTIQTIAPNNAQRASLYAFDWRGIEPANPGR